MAAEIERKFLVSGNDWRGQASKIEMLTDGLLSASPAGLLRVRIYDDCATLTLKSAAHGLVRHEYEYRIPQSDAEEMMRLHCNGEILEKTRHHVPFGGYVWHVDEYHGLLAGIILAEVELDHPKAQVPLPAWVGREVTGNRDYHKATMLRALKGAA